MKKLITILLTSAALLASHPGRAEAEEPSYIYTIIGGEATVIGYSGEPEFISIPDTLEGCPVTGIRDNAFYECDSLRQIALPDTIEKIGHHCFYACTSLESVQLPDSISEIGDGCFCGCTGLVSARLPEGLAEIPDSCFRACTSLERINLPRDAVAVKEYCFSACTELRQVNIGEKLKNIDKCVFYMCPSLDSIYIPQSVAEIGDFAVGFVPTEKGSEQKPGFTVIGAKGSAAEKYAEENSLGFTSADGAVQAMAVIEMSRKRSPYFYWFAAVWGALAAAGALTVVRIIHQKSTKR